MNAELTLLGWTLVLALFQIALASSFRSKETGMAYNMSARDTATVPPGIVTARLQRAQANLFETLPLFIAAILIAQVAGREGTATLMGAKLYLGGRVLYLPLYAFGVPIARTLAWGISIVGLVQILWAILGGV